MKKQLYILSFMIAMISNNALAFNDLAFFDETDQTSKWTVLEKKFISDIAGSKETFWKHASALAVGLVATASSVKCFTVNEDPSKDIMRTLLEPKVAYGIVSGVALSLLTVQGFQCFLYSHANRNAVADFFNNWDENKFYVPTQLEEAFDIIAERIELEGLDAVLENADEIVETIQFLVMRNFEKRYEKVLQVTAYNGLADTKTVGEILKNAVETSSKLAGGK